MKKVVKMLISSALIVAMMSGQMVGAFKFQKSYFDIQEQLDAATAANDYYGMIAAAEKQYNMVASAPVDSDTQAVMATKTYTIAESYEKLGDYENAAIWFEKAIAPNEAMGFDDAVRISKAKAKQFRPTFNLYKKTYDTQVNFGAKNEHELGVLAGIPFDSPTADVFENDSMVMIYHSHGADFNLFYENVLKRAEEEKKAVEIAYNLEGGASDVGMINMSSATISSFADILAKYPNVPIYFRFGGEVNEWEVKPGTEDYKQAFRTVATIMRQKAPNVAMVFGLNFVSSWGTEFTDYYPGDEYVDWVGVSLYLRKYFHGAPNTDFRKKIDEILFYGGDSADPVLIMEEIVKTFGDRKPIMIFESGATARTVGINDYSVDWAKRHLAKILHYLPMKYPQIKMIGYFDQYVAPENDDYSLKNNPELKDFYLSQINSTGIIKKRYDNDSVSGSVNCDNGFEVPQMVNTMSLYAGIYGSQNEKVDYFIDDVWVGCATAIPYSCDIDFSKYALGAHTFRYNVTSGSGKLYSVSVPFTVTENIKITVDGAELTGLDQPALIVNSRTLVPVRAIFEAVGATVEWDAETETVTATRGSDVVKMQIGSREIYKNGALYQIADVSPKIINARTLVPARIAAEIFGKTVGWDGVNRIVSVQ